MSNISEAINTSYGAIEVAPNSILNKYNFPIEKLGAKTSNTFEPYLYKDNVEDFYSALCAAYPNPTKREDWRTGLCSLAFLVEVMQWPENEARKIGVTWENLAADADKSDNESQWKDALIRTKEKVDNNEPTTTHLTILKKARENGWKPVAKITDALTALQDRFALISLGGKVGIIDKHKLNSTHADGTASRLVVMTRNDGGLLVLRFLSKEFPHVDAQKMLMSFFRDKNTTLYDGVEFDPRTTTPNVLNLWVGQTINPIEGTWPLIHSLLREVLCGGREAEFQYLLKYIAHALQRPWEKPGVMIILLGGQGVGKGTLARVLQRIWSATFLQVNRIDQIVGDFNGSLERAYTVFLDEALFVGDRKHSDALKSLVTEPTISVNEKHQPARQITSYHRFFSATNAEHFKATDRDDRRDFVLRVSEHRKGDHSFWNALNAEIEGLGVEAFAHYLLNLDLSNFNVRAKPNTRELTEQKLQSLEKFPRWWFDCLSQGTIPNFNDEWPVFISSASLLSLFKESDKSSRVYKQLIDRDLVTFMGKICPSAKREQGKEGLQRRRGYMLPTISEARTDFEKYIGDIVEWDTD
ncbi:MAG: primase-helicase family protein [Pseudomonadota bacterium]